MIFNFQDIFKSGFLENVSAITAFDMVLALTLSFSTGIFIFYVYKHSYSGIMYSSSFGVTLIALNMITALLILAVTSNIVLSLGMVGALSIVRFRTAIKEPSDIAFLFWSIASGIVISAGFIPLAIFGSLLIGLMLLFFSKSKTYESPYILVINCINSESEKKALEYITLKVKKLSLKSKTVSMDNIELNYEIRLKNSNTDFINELSNIRGITSTIMVSYNGDYMN